MKFTFKSLVLLVFILLLSGCTQKITIKSIKPAQVFDKDIKKVTIDKFQNDDISLAYQINSKMNDIYFDDKKYFNIVNRNDVDKILQEQKLQDSGLVDVDKQKDFALSDVNSMITGRVSSATYNRNRYFEERTDFDRCARYRKDDKGNRYCVDYFRYTVMCTNHNYNVSASIDINRINNGEIIYSKSYLKSVSLKRCMDDNSYVPTTQSIFEQMAKNIAYEFVSEISPTYEYLKVSLKEKPDTDYTSNEEKLLKNGLKLLELNEIKKANEIFARLVESTNSKSVTALYNYGLTQEFLGEYEVALESYKKAENITFEDEIDEDIVLALKRVEKSMDDKNKAYNQLNQH